MWLCIVQAPAKPKTPYGEMLQYYLKMEPQLFKAAVEQQLTRLRDEKDAKEDGKQSAEEQAGIAPTDSTDLVLQKRMEEVRASEVRATLEDLMYVSILEKFLVLGVDMLPRMDGKCLQTVIKQQGITAMPHSGVASCRCSDDVCRIWTGRSQSSLHHW